jgi:hypothetical protein
MVENTAHLAITGHGYILIVAKALLAAFWPTFTEEWLVLFGAGPM